MLLNDAKISDFFRITNVFGQIYEKKNAIIYPRLTLVISFLCFLSFNQ